jgi:hypothetical protein
MIGDCHSNIELRGSNPNRRPWQARQDRRNERVNNYIRTEKLRLNFLYPLLSTTPFLHMQEGKNVPYRLPFRNYIVSKFKNSYLK